MLRAGMMNDSKGLLTRIVAWALLGLLGGCASDPCSAEAIAAELAMAEAGTTVDLSACDRIEGAFVVPPGVRVGSDGGTLVVSEGEPAFTLQTDVDLETTLEGVSIRSSHTAVRSEGPGEVRIESVNATVVAGVGLVLGAARNDVVFVTLTGDVTEENRDESRWLTATSADSATHGIVHGAGFATIAESSITGFSWAAISSGDGLLGVPGGEVELGLSGVTLGHGLGIGIVSSAQALSLSEVTIEDVWSGVRGWPSYALLSTQGQVLSNQLTVRRADGFGLVAIAGEQFHVNLQVQIVGDVGVWLGTGVMARLEGARIEDVGFAGLIAVDAAVLVVRATRIEGVRAERRTVGPSGAIEVGDGIDLTNTPFLLDGVDILGAERAGLLIDEGIAFDAEDITGVRITAEGEGLGALVGPVDRGAETFTAAAVPATGITRMGTAAANDAAFTGSLAIAAVPSPPSATDALGVIAPMY